MFAHLRFLHVCTFVRYIYIRFTDTASTIPLKCLCRTHFLSQCLSACTYVHTYIQITKIKAGNTHSLALSDDGKVSVRVCVYIFVRICQ